MRSSSLGAGSTVRASDIGNLDDLPVVLGCQLGAPLHRKLGRTEAVDQDDGVGDGWFGGVLGGHGLLLMRMSDDVSSTLVSLFQLLSRQLSGHGGVLQSELTLSGM
jgi:hypothetical protein